METPRSLYSSICRNMRERKFLLSSADFGNVFMIHAELNLVGTRFTLRKKGYEARIINGRLWFCAKNDIDIDDMEMHIREEDADSPSAE